MGSYQVAPVEEVIPKARDAALKALDIDENLGAALTSLALINETQDLDFKTAEDRFRRAIELEPNYATAHHWYAEFLGYQGRLDEALAEIALARKLDPRSIIMAADHAYILTWARRYDRAIEQFRAVLAVEPGFGRAIGGIIGAYAQEGRLSEALAEALRWQQIAPEEHWPWGAAAFLYGRLGEPEKARQALQKGEEVCRRHGQDVRAVRAVYLAGMGLKEEAIAFLQEQCKQAPQSLIGVKVEPGFDWLRDDPRFDEIVRCVYGDGVKPASSHD
jgi:serine/threonine-protein kinase